jgi:hypothetical protein
MFGKSMWRKLYMIVAVAGAALVLVSSLKLSADANQIMLILWVIAAYGAIVVWLNKTPAAVREAPQMSEKAPVAEFFDADRQLQQVKIYDTVNE